MKFSSKSLLLIMSLVLMLSLASFNNNKVSANENEQLNEDLYSDLAEGEEVVDTFTELVLEDEEMDNEILVDEDSSSFGILERRKQWFATSTTYMGLSYGSWRYAGASTLSGGTLSASHTSTVANRYSGTLKIPVKKLDTVVGFDVTLTTSKTVGYSTKSYPKGKYRLEYRHVYKKYKVKQEQKYDRRTKTYDTKYVYPQKWVERQYRVVKF